MPRAGFETVMKRFERSKQNLSRIKLYNEELNNLYSSLNRVRMKGGKKLYAERMEGREREREKDGRNEQKLRKEIKRVNKGKQN